MPATHGLLFDSISFLLSQKICGLIFFVILLFFGPTKICFIVFFKACQLSNGFQQTPVNLVQLDYRYLDPLIWIRPNQFFWASSCCQDQQSICLCKTYEQHLFKNSHKEDQILFIKKRSAKLTFTHNKHL